MDIETKISKPASEQNKTSVSRNAVVEILHQIDPSLILTSYEVKKATNVGDNYMSEVSTLKITTAAAGEPNNNASACAASPRVIQIFLKQAPLDESMRQMLINCAAFTKEIQMYKNVLPTLGGYFEDLVPICYDANENSENLYMALEDLRLNGYTMPDRRLGLDIEHCKMAITCLAKFHALSYVKYKRNFDNMMEDYPFLVNHERIFVSEDKVTDYQLAYVGQTGHSYSKALANAGHETEARIVAEFFNNPQQILSRLHKLTSTPSICPVINHGDYWINNLLYKHDKETGRPTHMKFVDFQMIRAGSRTLDLHFLLQTSLGFELTSELEKQLLRLYHSEFEAHARALGWFEPEVLTLQQLEKEYEHFLEWGIYVGLFYLQFVHVEPEQLQEMDESPGDDVHESMFKFFSSLLNPKVVDKLLNVVRTQFPRLNSRM